MRPTWLVAKYMSDLRRREPRNVGVLLFTEEGVLNRFVGARADGTIDGRRTGLSGPHLDNFKAWVAFWRHAGTSTDDPRTLLATPTGDGNYLLEFGGEQLSGTVDPSALLDELFEMLVMDDQPEGPESVRVAAERAIVQLGLTDRIQRDATVQRPVGDTLDVLRFDYRYDNGQPHFLEAVSFGRGDNAWNAVHRACYLFEKLREVRELRNPQGIALVSEASPSDPMVVLRSIVPVIDLAAPSAVEQLADVLHI
ncbi:MAG: hypothetical protein ACR2HR_07275 [Euzebya sp.]